MGAAQVQLGVITREHACVSCALQPWPEACACCSITWGRCRGDIGEM